MWHGGTRSFAIVVPVGQRPNQLLRILDRRLTTKQLRCLADSDAVLVAEDRARIPRRFLNRGMLLQGLEGLRRFDWVDPQLHTRVAQTFELPCRSDQAHRRAPGTYSP